jgi:hypothetical protein
MNRRELLKTLGLGSAGIITATANLFPISSNKVAPGVSVKEINYDENIETFMVNTGQIDDLKDETNIIHFTNRGERSICITNIALHASNFCTASVYNNVKFYSRMKLHGKKVELINRSITSQTSLNTEIYVNEKNGVDSLLHKQKPLYTFACNNSRSFITTNIVLPKNTSISLNIVPHNKVVRACYGALIMNVEREVM